ncbi:MAG: hypothetical protein EON58_01990 [Alphaproteobacteria bacterium]|nr:MAG: hypothetical protein EON58_01990 [Alphaproteobacteria bacterium]
MKIKQHLERAPRVAIPGEIYNRLIVLREDPPANGRRRVRAQCICGKETVVSVSALRSGHTQSCGCLAAETAAMNGRAGTIHGMGNHPLSYVYCGMISRCENPSNLTYGFYGGRGIYVCEEWKADRAAFFDWAIQSGYRKGLQLDRIDNSGPYSPKNCRWVTSKENNANKRTNRIIEAFGERKCLAQWADDPRCSITPAIIAQRVDKLGWDAERAISTPKVMGHPASARVPKNAHEPD